MARRAADPGGASAGGLSSILTELTLQLLGAFRVHDAAGGEIRIASRKGRALLAYLALRPGESHSRDRLATLLWEDADEELARTSLRQALAALRKSLPADAHEALLADTRVGRHRSRHRRTATCAHSAARCIAGTRTSLQEAMTHYRGDLLDGFDARSTAFDEWLSSERLTLRKQMSERCTSSPSCASANDDSEGALAACTRLVALEPLNEAAHRTLMELHARRNAYAEALRQYRVCRDVLRRELDVAPEPATEQLYRDLMRRRRAALGARDGETRCSTIRRPRDCARQRAGRSRSKRDRSCAMRRSSSRASKDCSNSKPARSRGIARAARREFQRRVQDAVQDFGGRADRRVGSNVLAVFGIPAAYGNEAERAARAALTLRDMRRQTRLARAGTLALRIGIAQGQVLCGAEIFPLTRPADARRTRARGARRATAKS